MKKEAYNASAGTVTRGRSYPYRNWAGRGGAMDLRCPNCKSTDLKKVSLACEEGLYRVPFTAGAAMNSQLCCPIFRLRKERRQPNESGGQ